MQPDQDSIRFQRERIADDVTTAWEIEHSMAVDCLLDGGSVVSRAVSGDAKRVDVHPVVSGWQRRYRRRQRSGQGAQRHRVVEHADAARHPLTRHDEPIIETPHPVDRTLPRSLPPAFAKLAENRLIL